MELKGKLCHPNLSFDCTTGTLLHCQKPVDLDLKENKDLLNLVENLDGQEVVVTGKMREIHGIEKIRHVLEVDCIEKTS